MEFASIHSSTTAFVAGLVTSLHCVGMCGPLACWLAPTKAGEDATVIFAVYQGARLASYLLLGIVLGAIGAWPLTWLGQGAVGLLPWVLVIYFIVVAFRLDRFIRKPLLLVRLGMRLQQWSRGRSRMTVAAVMGGATPLLPCGPLYFVATLAALSGSALRGGEFMLAFGFGTLPLLWLAQSQFVWLRSVLSPAAMIRVQRGLALVAALVVAWRLGGSMSGSTNWLCF